MPADAPTIQSGIDAAKDGDTVLISRGTYTENLDFKGKAVLVTSGAKSYADAAGTILHGISSDPTVVFHTGESRTSILNGITIENSATTAVFFNDASGTLSNSIIANSSGCGVVVQGSNANALIVGNHVFGTTNKTTSCQTSYVPYVGISDPGSGLSLIGTGDVEVSGNLIEKNAGDTNVSIEGTPASTVLVKNNTLYNNGGYGRVLTSSGVGHFYLVQNLIFKNTDNIGRVEDSGGSAVGAGDAFPAQPGYVVIEGNTIVENTYTNSSEGIQLTMGGQIILATVENNTFVSSRAGLVVDCAYEGLAFPVIFNNNDAFNEVSSASTNCQDDPGAIFSSNLSVDPQFVSSATNDFHSLSTSPLIGKGDINAPSLPAADLDGKNRTVCGSVDMGVYQTHPHPPILLTASTNPSPGGDSVIFTAQLTGNCNVPTGVVTFFDGAIPIGTGTLDSSASSSLTTAFLVVGEHTITAHYPGDFNFEDSTSNALDEKVAGFATATSLAVAPNPASAFQQMSLTATVAASYGTPSGTVTFLAGENSLGTAPLNGSGVATLSTTTLRAGTYNIVAVFNATTKYAGSISVTVVEVVNGASTTATLVAAPNPSAFGQSVTFTADVSAGTSTATPTGTVNFFDGANSINTASLSALGGASFITASLTLGSHNIKAVYTGSANDNATTSNTVVQVVVPATTTVGLTVAPNPANLGQAVTFTASVNTTISGLQSPSGTVSFTDQTGPLGSAPVSSGQAVFTTSSLAIGTHNLVATFVGSAGFAASSATVAEVVQNFDFTLTVAPSAPVIPSGDYEDLLVTLTPVGGFNGTVDLSCASVPVHAECSFSASSVSLVGGAQTVILTINTSDLRGYGNQVGKLNPLQTPHPFRTLPILAGVLLPALLLSRFRSRPVNLLLLLIAIGGLIVAQGCSGKLPGKTPPGVYSITIAGAGSTISHSVALSLKVTP